MENHNTNDESSPYNNQATVYQLDYLNSLFYF